MPDRPCWGNGSPTRDGSGTVRSFAGEASLFFPPATLTRRSADFSRWKGTYETWLRRKQAQDGPRRASSRSRHFGVA
jgi:hypothetical protein